MRPRRKMTDRETVCLACGIFEAELRAFQQRGELPYPLRFLCSMLHLKPVELSEKLSAAVDEELQAGRRVVLVYGDCHAAMPEMTGRPDVVRTEGVNCCEIVLGSQRYRELRASGAFFLMNDWALRWREIFTGELGLSETNATDLMREMHSKLIYIDTGAAPVPRAELDATSAYCGLGWEVLTISLEPLRQAIAAAVRRLDEQGETR